MAAGEPNRLGTIGVSMLMASPIPTNKTGERTNHKHGNSKNAFHTPIITKP